MTHSNAIRLLRSLGRITLLVLLAPLACVVSNAQTARQLAQNSFPSVVLLVMQDENGQPVSLGSGFFVGNGVIVTNLHVVRGASSGKVKLVGQTSTYAISGLIGVNANADIVLLEVPGAKAPALELSQGTDLAVGDVVYAVGNPEGLEGTFSQGIVSGFRGSGPERLLQITAPISPGSSGGPIINSQGEVVGVAVATFKEGQNLNFAVPASYVISLLKNTGKPRPLSGEPDLQREAKVAPVFGSEHTEGVVGIDFRWAGCCSKISFAILNQTASPVKDVHFLAVFFEGDKKHGFHAIDYVEGMTCPDEVIIPNLPKRQDQFKVKSDCFDLWPHAGVEQRTRKVEIRVLDFKLAK